MAQDALSELTVPGTLRVGINLGNSLLVTGAQDEFLLTATVQNLKRLANHTTRPPPRPVMA